jgi:hypothetical protein
MMQGIDEAADKLMQEAIKVSQKYAHEEKNAKSKRQTEVEKAVATITEKLKKVHG